MGFSLTVIALKLVGETHVWAAACCQCVCASDTCIGWLTCLAGSVHNDFRWESVVMLRKLAVLIVAAVVVDPYLQVVAAVLVVNVALLLHVRFEPFHRADLNNLESGALLAVLITQVLSIMYLRLQAEAVGGDALDVGTEDSTDGATDVIVTLILCGVNMFIIALCVHVACVILHPHSLTRRVCDFLVHIASVVPPPWMCVMYALRLVLSDVCVWSDVCWTCSYVVSIVREMKTAAARRKAAAKRPGDGRMVNNPMRRARTGRRRARTRRRSALRPVRMGAASTHNNTPRPPSSGVSSPAGTSTTTPTPQQPAQGDGKHAASAEQNPGGIDAPPVLAPILAPAGVAGAAPTPSIPEGGSPVDRTAPGVDALGLLQGAHTPWRSNPLAHSRTRPRTRPRSLPRTAQRALPGPNAPQQHHGRRRSSMAPIMAAPPARRGRRRSSLFPIVAPPHRVGGKPASRSTGAAAAASPSSSSSTFSSSSSSFAARPSRRASVMRGGRRSMARRPSVAFAPTGGAQ